MKIKDGLYVTFEYSLFLDGGDRVGGTEPDRPIGFIVGQNHMLPAVEKQLLGMQAGEKASLWVLPQEAYGEYDPQKQQEVPKSNFPPGMELQRGMFFQAKGANGPVAFTILAVNDDSVTVDLNHPLAGKRLRLEVEVHDVRKLTPQEAQQLAAPQQGVFDPLMPPGIAGGTIKV